MTPDHDILPDWPVYGLTAADKRDRLATALSHLTRHHAEHCAPYARILQAEGIDAGSSFALDAIPFIPVQLFKRHDLASITPEARFKILTSSGTTSQAVSRITLDRATAAAQSKALVRILQQFLGKARLPMLIIDHPGVIKDRHAFSARGAGILGMSSFGRDHTYALRDEDMSLDIDAIQAFAQRYRGQEVLIFGFTFMVWKYFQQAVRHLPDPPRFERARLFHSGGWKKLQDEAVDNDTFKAALRNTLGIPAIHNFYGMVEQVGSIFVECEHGRLHTPAFADVIIRNPLNWSVQPKGQAGVIQVLSVLPRSYPGHSLLTEDVGIEIGEDDCPCGRLGKTFQVQGRLARAELRGCSDTHTEQPSGEAQ